MKYLKLYESYFEDKYSKFKEEVKSHVDSFMSKILDEYQVDSSGDCVSTEQDKNKVLIILLYDFISVNDKDIENVKKEFLNIEKIFTKYGCSFMYCLNSVNNYGEYEYTGVYANDIDSFLLDVNVINELKSSGLINFGIIIKSKIDEFGGLI